MIHVNREQLYEKLFDNTVLEVCKSAMSKVPALWKKLRRLIRRRPKRGSRLAMRAIPARKRKIPSQKDNKRKTVALASGRHLEKPRF